MDMAGEFTRLFRNESRLEELREVREADGVASTEEIVLQGQQDELADILSGATGLGDSFTPLILAKFRRTACKVLRVQRFTVHLEKAS